ncbi:MAG: hypothetical protein U9R74_15435 [Pseudomonadota bacterium]|nr:hypothetical protein [Pseudomonadota bacterium]
MALRTSRRFLEAPPCDEVLLSVQARKELAGLSSPPTAAEILELARRSSVDLATRVFFEGIIASSHGKFVRRLQAFPRDNVSHQGKGVKFLVLPGMFYREHPEVGADGELAIEIARRFGFDAERVDTDSTGSVTGNSRILKDRLADETQGDIWLVSLSKGSSDVRHYLQHHHPNKRIKGWVNVAGIFKGAPLADRKLATPLKRAANRVLCTLLGIDYEALSEMRTTHPFWQRDAWPSRMDMIHIVPVPLGCHIQGKLGARHTQLQDRGPNDGFVPLTDVMSLPGHIYPVWGSDHFLRTPDLSPLLYRLCHYIAYRTIESRGRTT